MQIKNTSESDPRSYEGGSNSIRTLCDANGMLCDANAMLYRLGYETWLEAGEVLFQLLYEENAMMYI